MTFKLNPNSKTAQAIAYMEQHRVTAFRAAQEFGIQPSNLYRSLLRLKAREDTNRCPHCGRSLHLTHKPLAKSTIAYRNKHG